MAMILFSFYFTYVYCITSCKLVAVTQWLWRQSCVEHINKTHLLLKWTYFWQIKHTSSYYRYRFICLYSPIAHDIPKQEYNIRIERIHFHFRSIFYISFWHIGQLNLNISAYYDHKLNMLISLWTCVKKFNYLTLNPVCQSTRTNLYKKKIHYLTSIFSF